jgi:hypothetical protein
VVRGSDSPTPRFRHDAVIRDPTSPTARTWIEIALASVALCARRSLPKE